MYNCKIFHDFTDRIVLLDIDVESLKDLAKELDMSYQQIYDLHSRKGQRKYQQFKYFPKIQITQRTRKETWIKL